MEDNRKNREDVRRRKREKAARFLKTLFGRKIVLVSAWIVAFFVVVAVFAAWPETG